MRVVDQATKISPFLLGDLINLIPFIPRKLKSAELSEGILVQMISA
jgi:hypothetical protein